MTDETTTETETEEKAKPATPSIDAQEFAALKESINKLEAKNRELLEEKAKARKEAERAAIETAKKSGDIESLERSWGEKLSKRESELSEQLQERDRMIHQITVKARAISMAGDLALPGSAEVLRPHIESRLSVEIRNGMPEIRVRDAAGQPSAMTLEDLKREFASNPAFAPILSAGRASGPGAPSGSSSGGKSSKKFTEYTSDELKQLLHNNPQEYERVRAEYLASPNRFIGGKRR
jgi:hypothetical protein